MEQLIRDCLEIMMRDLEAEYKQHMDRLGAEIDSLNKAIRIQQRNHAMIARCDNG